MGYGGTTVGTVAVDLVTTDVDAIVDGICGIGDSGSVMRRRECRHCGKRMTTWEKPIGG